MRKHQEPTISPRVWTFNHVTRQSGWEVVSTPRIRAFWSDYPIRDALVLIGTCTVIWGIVKMLMWAVRL